MSASKTVPTIVPATCQNRTVTANRSQIVESEKSNTWKELRGESRGSRVGFPFSKPLYGPFPKSPTFQFRTINASVVSPTEQ